MGRRPSEMRPRRLRETAVAAAAALCAPVAGMAADLRIELTGLRSDAGAILAAVCREPDFLSDRCSYVGRADAAAGAVTVPGIPPGRYAVQVFHDENGNDDLDRGLFGGPLEGMGFSRDAPMRFGPPRFEDAAIEVPEGGAEQTLTMRYFK